jgi:diadenosine tetraphosphate (Ap4A) HIT family hydrolase
VLQPPTEVDRPQHGAGGVDCHACAAPDDEYLWTSERWRVRPLDAPSGLPLVVLVEPREHVAEMGDMPEELAAEMGVVLARCERAARSVGEIGRVHVCRWNDGAEHLHWWVMARPARLPQVVGTFAALWDDILPPLPEKLWRANLAAFVAALA